MFCITLFHVRIIDILFSFCGISYTDVTVWGPIIISVVKPGVPAKLRRRSVAGPCLD